jgi:predicted acylesterase/phospholipase RssA
VVRVARYCDIVMKGGITSGVVYPLAAVELAKEHRFRNIGGTSAGAIAAAAVAAAELGRRSGSNPDAYRKLEALPKWLGANLGLLFQPTRRMRPFFQILLTALGGGLPAKALAPLNAFPLAASVGLLPGAAFIAATFALDPGAAMKVLATAVGALVLLPLGVLAAIAISAAWRLRGLSDSYYGICPGNDPGGKAPTPPLTRWLAEFLDELAGRGPEDPPLTFGDLGRLEEPDGEPGLNLQMMTSCISQGRPYTLPFSDDERPWFKPEELLELFPEPVVRHMVAAAEREDVGPPAEGLVRFPRAEDLPVVVATRMSLSFPVLIAAVPLHAENHAREDRPELERCWFSDGGITSNFPVHFFDSPLPRWPTYAIDLVPLYPGQTLSDEDRENVWLPRTNREGIGEAWLGWEEKGGFGRLAAFLDAIFRTAQNWIDNRQMRGPGYRDRIAHVRLSKTEGGMNLSMDGPTIAHLAERGRSAAAQLSARFAPAPPPGTELTWDNQRWLRYRAYMTLVEQQGEQALKGFGVGPGEPPASPLKEPPLGDGESYGWEDVSQEKFAQGATADLLDLFEGWSKSGERFSGGSPGPPIQPWQIPRV